MEISKPTSNITDYDASQISDVGTTYYDLSNKNLKLANTRVGQSMNLYDAGKTFNLSMVFSTKESMG